MEEQQPLTTAVKNGDIYSHASRELTMLIVYGGSVNNAKDFTVFCIAVAETGTE